MNGEAPCQVCVTAGAIAELNATARAAEMLKMKRFISVPPN
jgi:hypothetical protein